MGKEPKRLKCSTSFTADEIKAFHDVSHALLAGRDTEVLRRSAGWQSVLVKFAGMYERIYGDNE